jgi:hypothetical protein
MEAVADMIYEELKGDDAVSTCKTPAQELWDNCDLLINEWDMGRLLKIYGLFQPPRKDKKQILKLCPLNFRLPAAKNLPY